MDGRVVSTIISRPKRENCSKLHSNTTPKITILIFTAMRTYTVFPMKPKDREK